MAATPSYDGAADLVHESADSLPLQPPRSDSHAFSALKDILFGSTAGILGKYIEYPFDTVKVRLQSQNLPRSHPAYLSGPLDGFRAAWRAPEGVVRSLYTGISAPLLGAAVETSSLFFSYRVIQDAVISAVPTYRLQKENGEDGKVELSLPMLGLCGAASGAFTSLALTPIELVKCQMQVPGTSSGHQNSISSIIANTLREKGILGFWHGQLGTLIRETGGSAAWFGSFEATKLFFRTYDERIKGDDDVMVYQQLLGGATAGMSYNFICYPADTIKSRMQTNPGKEGGFGSIARQLWQEQGLRGFYRGCGITVFRAAPSSAVIFTIYEALKKYYA